MTSYKAPIALRAVVALLGLVTCVGLALAFSQPALFELLKSEPLRPLFWGALGVFGLLAASSLWLSVRSQRLPQGMPGRLRSRGLGFAFLGLGMAAATLTCAVLSAVDELPLGTPLNLEDALLMFPRALRAVLIGSTLVATIAGLSGVAALIGLWFLVPVKIRSLVFACIDFLLIAATAWLTFAFDFVPKSSAPQDVIGPGVRLLATFLLGVRLFSRGLPYVLNAIEGIDFRSLVAARHLRAKKSGFLAAISFLSILAVSVSSCALTTTLSVMGGFRQDLKRKILGNNAHIVVDQAHGRLEDFAQLLEQTRSVADVKGVSPYVTGEVMISSASNLAGAVLRGIDVEKIGEVSDLPQNMKIGSLDFLVHPEKLTRLPPSQLGVGIGLPKVSRFNTDSEASPQKTSRLSKELAALLGGDAGVTQQELDDLDDLDALSDEEALFAKKPSLARVPEPAATAVGASSLPGIVVGQELARSLRLYLGDEVNVVTPLGELGPTGPMPKSRAFRVAGVFYSGMYEYDMKFAYVTLDAAQKFLGAKDAINGIEVTVNEPETARATAARIATALGRPNLRVRGWEELNQNLFGALALEKLAMFIALGIAILVASFCIVGTLTLMVQEKGREVAVLKAMGAGDRTIISIFVLEGTLIGVFGSVLGLALGYVACFAMEHFGVRLNPEVYYIDRLPVHTDSSEFLAVGIAAVLVCLIVTIYPAQLASRLRPVDALRYE